MAFGSNDVESHLRTIFRRCVKCPPGAPSCPPCAADETCSLQAESCGACASTICLKVGSLPGQASLPSSTPVGAIAGGVIGGVVGIVILTYLVWRFCIRNRRKAYDDQTWTDQKVEKRDQSTLARGDRQSTVTMGSIASTVLTRASNVIQIAYIPGVTNRTPPESPAFVPPVPPLPFGTPGSSAVSTPHFEQDQHFFMPGDLRDSTYSDMTEDQRKSMAPSITPSLARTSVATTLYRNNAVVPPLPAQQAFRTKPAVVSVKSGLNTPGSQNAPPLPQMPQHLGSGNSSIVARNVTARPIEVKKTGSGASVPTFANLARASSGRMKNSGRAAPAPPQDIYEEKEVVLGQKTGLDDRSPLSQILKPKPSFASTSTGSSSAISAILPTRGPLRDTKSGGATHRHSNSGGLNAMIEDAMNRAARDLTHTGLGSRPDLHHQNSKDSGPFSDANEVKENLV